MKEPELYEIEEYIDSLFEENKALKAEIKDYKERWRKAELSANDWAGKTQVANEMISDLKAEIERKDEAINYCSNQIVCAVNHIKLGYILKADKNLNSGLSAIQETLSEEE